MSIPPARGVRTRVIVHAHMHAIVSELMLCEEVPTEEHLELESGGWRITAVVQPVERPSSGLTPCEADTLLTLREAAQRLTTMDVLDAMDRAGRLHGESTIKMALAKLVRSGLAGNSREAPRGYYITDCGIAVVDGSRDPG